MHRKHKVRFPAEGGDEISAWLFVPEGRTGPLPAITMAYGYAGTKYHGLERFAETFVYISGPLRPDAFALSRPG